MFCSFCSLFLYPLVFSMDGALTGNMQTFSEMVRTLVQFISEHLPKVCAN